MPGNSLLSINRYKSEMGALVAWSSQGPPCRALFHAKRPADGEHQCPAGGAGPQTCQGTRSYTPPLPHTPHLSSKTPPSTKEKNPVTTPGQQPGSPMGEETPPLLSTSPHWSLGLSPALPCPRRDTQLLDRGMGLSSAAAQLCISKVFPGLHRRGVLHPAG